MENSHPIGQVSSTDSSSSIDIGDYQFCTHGVEKCGECDVDFREDNAFTAGLDPIDEREVRRSASKVERSAGIELTTEFEQALSVEYSLNKDGVPQCKKHKNTMCTNCFGFKKVSRGACASFAVFDAQITRRPQLPVFVIDSRLELISSLYFARSKS